MRKGLSEEVALELRFVWREGRTTPWSGGRTFQVQKCQVQSLRWPWGIWCQKEGTCLGHQSKETSLSPTWSWLVWPPSLSDSSLAILPCILHAGLASSQFSYYFRHASASGTFCWLFSLPGMLFCSYLPVQLHHSFKSLLKFYLTPLLKITSYSLSHQLPSMPPVAFSCSIFSFPFISF